MTDSNLKKILNKIRSSDTSEEEAFTILKNIPYQDLQFVKIDHHRVFRKGYPEVVYAKGKTAEQLIEIINNLLELNGRVFVTRLDEEKYDKIKKQIKTHEYNNEAGCLLAGETNIKEGVAEIPVLTAGTADIPVAEEAAMTLKFTGNPCKKIYDVGVSGIHRFLDKKKELDGSKVVIVVAGMDGVLPTIVGGVSKQLVIAVPTSTGYGASFEGLAPLLTMMNACAAGVVVVNIDNGFGAGYAAALVNRL